MEKRIPANAKLVRVCLGDGKTMDMWEYAFTPEDYTGENRPLGCLTLSRQPTTSTTTAALAKAEGEETPEECEERLWAAWMSGDFL